MAKQVTRTNAITSICRLEATKQVHSNEVNFSNTTKDSFILKDAKTMH